MSDVTTQHPDFIASFPKWKKCEDAAAGEDAVKAAKDAYLPKPNPTDKSLENQERYKHYVMRAVYYNATGRTLQGLIGLAFTEPPAVVVPESIAYAEDDISGSGLPLLQQAQGTLAEVLKTARAGLLVDFPSTDGSQSRADEAKGDIRPTVTFYPASAIINWRTTRVGGKTVLSKLVLQECYEVEDESGFGTTEKVQYRVLYLDSTYRVEIWQQTTDLTTNAKTWAAVSDYSPLNGNGAPWDEIPFTFVGAQNNDVTVDSAPLYDIATLNLAHYRNSADYEDSVYSVGQPQYWIGGLTEQWRDWLDKKGISVGARSVLLLPVGGSFGIAQAQPNSLAKEAMSAKEAQMAALGARLIQAATNVRTATQVDSEDAIAHSVLALACTNLNAAYTQALEWFCEFANTEGDASLSIPTDFSSYALDAQTLIALLQGVQSAAIPLTDFWSRLRAAGIIAATKTDEQIQEELESQPQVGAPLSASPQDDAAANPTPESAAAA